MNSAYLHLAINHIPVIGLPLVLIFLVHSLCIKNPASQKFALKMLVFLAALGVAVFFTGEPAEEVVEHLPDITEGTIHNHEEAAEVSLVFMILSGVAALAALWFSKDESKNSRIRWAVAGIATLTLLSLGYTANLGGKIRHSEIELKSN